MKEINLELIIRGVHKDIKVLNFNFLVILKKTNKARHAELVSV